VSVDSAGDQGVSAGRWLRGGAWETFTLKDWNGGALQDGHTVTLQAHGGLYLSVPPGPGRTLFANAQMAGPAERFILHKLGGSGGAEILGGDAVALETRSGRYLGADLKGHGAIRALRNSPGPAETFRYLPQGE